ncbi:putative MFS family arabinose efflux permease [Curtobacterium luteum]|uniref:MFS family arabinose efflux permease n=1 Tax=Curtobacterium luteum TaxID=33881 RepID=A0A8H9G8G3_9MICO|nr:MFS transporter [Curtobacterium luteum]MBM7801589.1 putative MFS family arabinose efflux permease [Curtobacterium luteum]NUU52087.1 MFS transporter [Curtobacterium luteum]GGK89319.1 MFS transporter [Curtobacterium luteum]
MSTTTRTSAVPTHTRPITVTTGSIVGIAVLGLATFFAITTELMPVGLLGTMSRDLGVSESTMGVVVTVYAAAVALLALPLTSFTARLPRKTVLVATLVGYAVSNVMVALAPSFAVVCAGRVVGGVAHALFFSVASAYATRIVPPRLAGRAIAFVYSGSSLGFVLGVPIATWVAQTIGWRPAVGAVAVASAILAGVALAFLPSVRGASSPHIGSPRAWARTGLLSVVVADLLLFAGHYVVYTYIGPYAIDAGLDAALVSGALLVLGATGVIGLWLAGLFVDRAPRQTLIAAVAVMAAAFAVLPFVHGSLLGTMVVAGVWMAANGTTGTLFMAAAIRTGGVSPDIAGALVNGASNIGIAGGAALGGQALSAVGLQWLPFAGGAVLLASLGVVVAARKGFPVHTHAQEHLSTSSLEAITSSLAVVTTSVPTISRAIQTVTGSVAVVTGAVRTRRSGEPTT